jgi:hypothetical protein
MSTPKRKLTDTEKHINRLRRKFERTPTRDTYNNWLKARDHFRFTTEGVHAYHFEAMEALIDARSYPSGGYVYPDGYEYAKALLDNAVLLEKLVRAKLAAARATKAAEPAMSFPMAGASAREAAFHEEVKSFLLINA